MEPDRVVDLRDDHPAVVNATTKYLTTVRDAWDVERLLVSGVNNAKLGGVVEKGAWIGLPVYHLTLEERATCPRPTYDAAGALTGGCAVWNGCYGNAMHLARRHKHDGYFIDLLGAELWELARQHRAKPARHTGHKRYRTPGNARGGIVIRLHTLGDFFSVEYVEQWGRWIDEIPGLRVFGYTANHPDAADPGERAIGQAIAALTARAWDRFAIRFSTAAPRPQGSSIFMEASDDPGVIMCPAQTGATDACVSCGLCWAPAAREKSIGFLKHGPKYRAKEGEGKAPHSARGKSYLNIGEAAGEAPRKRKSGRKPNPAVIKRRAEWRAIYEAGKSGNEIAKMFNVSPGYVSRELDLAGVTKRKGKRAGNGAKGLAAGRANAVLAHKRIMGYSPAAAVKRPVISISDAEARALIDDAAKRAVPVTVLPPGRAAGVRKRA